MATFSNLTSLGDHVEKGDGRLQATGPNGVGQLVRMYVLCLYDAADLRGEMTREGERAPSGFSSISCFFSATSRFRGVAIGLRNQ